jgi:retron-type reverse transcriptase
MFEEIVDMNNLIRAYYLARKSKKYSQYVQKFEINREYNLWQLQQDLISGEYIHGDYNSFEILDPKPRIIQVSPFRDRIVHQAIYLVLNPIFELDFIEDSYAYRKGKGSQRAIKRFEYFWQKLSHKSKYSQRGVCIESGYCKVFL